MNDERICLVKGEETCSGCGACMAACPQKAITMQHGENGCLYPMIDHDLCIRCGKCLRICEYSSGRVAGCQPQAVYAAVGKQADLVQQSASGGLFATLAMAWIAQGGVVAGAVMDCNDGVQVYHMLTDQANAVLRMQGSKYVQSDAWRCYAAVQEAVRGGKRVLFSGTPCQTAAVRSLTGNPENLVTMELICHGVPPVRMLDEYARILSRRFRRHLTNFTFREKRIPKSFCARLDMMRGRKKSSFYLRSHELSFYKYFLEGAIYRENCYTCPYARLERASDLTIGDYWGVEKYHAADINGGAMEKRRDWSCLMVNTAKGEQLLSAFGQNLTLHPSQLVWAAAENHQLRHPTQKPAGREDILRRYEQGGYAAVEAAFIRKNGGWLRYFLQVMKQLHRNKALLNK